MASTASPSAANLTNNEMVNSQGILESENNLTGFLTHPLPRLELQMGLIFLISYMFHFFLKRFGITSFVAQALTGLILGPSFLGRYDFMKRVVFPHESQELTTTVALLGYNFFLFLTAVKMELRMVFMTGRKAMSIGTASVIAPLLGGIIYGILHEKESKTETELFANSLVMTVQSLTTFTVTSYVMRQLKIANSELGRLGLSSALLSDLLSIFLIMVSNMVKEASFSGATKQLTGVLIYILIAIFILRPAMLWVIKKTPQGTPVYSSYIYIIIALAFGSAVYFHLFHQVQFQGPLLFGFAVPAGPPLGSALVEKFETFTSVVLIPILVATSMMRVDFSLLFASEFAEFKFYFSIIALTFAIKLIACLVIPLYYKVPLTDSVAIALIMTSKGIVELFAFAQFRDAELITDEVFAVLGLYILFNSTIIPILVKGLYDPSRKYAGYEARNITKLKPDSEFRILACIHKPDDVTSVLRLLDSSHPTEESPISVYVFHLIQLVGRATPAFMVHQKQKPISNSYSQNVIISFNQYEQNNWTTVSVQTFTAISPFKLMNEDICAFALDKRTSLILLPLHRKWSVHGNVESEDNNLRILNSRVLDRAPCSVGILSDRGKLGRQTPKQFIETPLSICMIFLGGNDDREALALGKRMAKRPNSSLTVIHFIPEVNKMIESEDSKLDDEALADVKNPDNCIDYREKTVTDGPMTALILRSILEEFDLFLVGRRYGIESPQTVGLSEWTELPEIGIIGDLLASKDLETKACVLIVQQQKQTKKLMASLR